MYMYVYDIHTLLHHTHLCIICLHTYVYMYVHLCIYTCICICRHKYSYMYMHTYINKIVVKHMVLCIHRQLYL